MFPHSNVPPDFYEVLREKDEQIRRMGMQLEMMSRMRDEMMELQQQRRELESTRLQYQPARFDIERATTLLQDQRMTSFYFDPLPQWPDEFDEHDKDRSRRRDDMDRERSRHDEKKKTTSTDHDRNREKDSRDRYRERDRECREERHSSRDRWREESRRRSKERSRERERRRSRSREHKDRDRTERSAKKELIRNGKPPPVKSPPKRFSKSPRRETATDRDRKKEKERSRHDSFPGKKDSKPPPSSSSSRDRRSKPSSSSRDEKSTKNHIPHPKDLKPYSETSKISKPASSSSKSSSKMTSSKEKTSTSRKTESSSIQPSQPSSSSKTSSKSLPKAGNAEKIERDGSAEIDAIIQSVMDEEDLVEISSSDALAEASNLPTDDGLSAYERLQQGATEDSDCDEYFEEDCDEEVVAIESVPEAAENWQITVEAQDLDDSDDIIILDEVSTADVTPSPAKKPPNPPGTGKRARKKARQEQLKANGVLEEKKSPAAAKLTKKQRNITAQMLRMSRKAGKPVILNCRKGIKVEQPPTYLKPPTETTAINTIIKQQQKSQPAVTDLTPKHRIRKQSAAEIEVLSPPSSALIPLTENSVPYSGKKKPNQANQQQQQHPLPTRPPIPNQRKKTRGRLTSVLLKSYPSIPSLFSVNSWNGGPFPGGPPCPNFEQFPPPPLGAVHPFYSGGPPGMMPNFLQSQFFHPQQQPYSAYAPPSSMPFCPVQQPSSSFFCPPQAVDQSAVQAEIFLNSLEDLEQNMDKRGARPRSRTPPGQHQQPVISPPMAEETTSLSYYLDQSGVPVPRIGGQLTGRKPTNEKISEEVDEYDIMFK